MDMRRPGKRPRLLVLNQYYWPGVEATAHLLTELSESLASSFDVTVVTGVVSGHEHDERSFDRKGVRVERVASTAFDRTQITRRAVNYLTYLAGALVRGLRGPRPDVVLCLTDPPMVGALGVVVARRHRAPLVIVSQDVFPEIATALGRLDNRVVVGLLGRLVRFSLLRADRVVAIGETMRRRLEAKGIRPERLVVIPNWTDTTAITPQPRDNEWAREQGLDGRFVVMHSGNVGHAQDLETLVCAATLLRDLDDVVVAIVGFGARHDAMVRLADRLDATNVRFLPYQPRGRLSQSLSSADVHVVGLGRGLAGYVVPSRILGVLAAGRPVVAAADEDSETAALVREAGCGVHVPAGEPPLLADAIRSLHARPGELAEMGARGRAWVEREGDRSVAVGRYEALLTELLRA